MKAKVKRLRVTADPADDERASFAREQDKPEGGRDGALRRWLARLSLLSGVLVVAAASVLCAWGLRRYLHRSPRFAIASATVEGNHRLGAQAVLKAAGIAAGANIFDVDEERAAQAVRSNPWVESAKVVKELPDAVSVTIVEREPVLIASIADKLVLCDGKGVLFKQVEPGDPSDLPVVTGLSPADLARDREGATLRLRRVLDLYADLDRSSIAARRPVQEIHTSAEGDLTAFVGSEGVALAFGQAPYRAKVARAERIFAELAAKKGRPDVLFLDNSAHRERVVVRTRAAGAAEKKPK